VDAGGEGGRGVGGWPGLLHYRGGIGGGRRGGGGGGEQLVLRVGTFIKKRNPGGKNDYKLGTKRESGGDEKRAARKI